MRLDVCKLGQSRADNAEMSNDSYLMRSLEPGRNLAQRGENARTEFTPSLSARSAESRILRAARLHVSPSQSFPDPERDLAQIVPANGRNPVRVRDRFGSLPGTE